MRRPVYAFEIVRDTDAPAEAVIQAVCSLEGLELPGAYSLVWQAQLTEVRHWGLWTSGDVRVEDTGARRLLTLHRRYKGWGVLVAMGWLRWRGERYWERLIATLLAASNASQ